MRYITCSIHYSTQYSEELHSIQSEGFSLENFRESKPIFTSILLLVSTNLITFSGVGLVGKMPEKVGKWGRT